MFQPIARLLNAERGEEEPVILMFGQGFFMGIFLYSYKIIAEAMFLSRMSDRLAEAMFISAALGVLSTSLFSALQNRISFAKLTFLNFSVFFIFLGLIRFSSGFADARTLDILIFASFVLIQPVISVSMLTFWGLFGRIFDLRQSKRIIGSIDSGQLLAALITSLSIPFAAKFISQMDFFLVAMAAILFCLVFFSIIVRKHDLEKHRSEKGGKKINTKIISILKDRYVVWLSFFLLLSIISFQFVHFSFLSVTEIYFPRETQLVSFLGYFHASIMIFSLIIQMVVNERLIAMYGLKTALLILPVILLAFTAFAILTGGIFGYDGSGENFIWFFLFIALSKLFSESLRESLEQSSFKLFFMPLDVKIRFDIQAKVEGVINEFSRVVAGVLILGMGLLSFFRLIHYSVLLVVVILVWIWSVGKLYSEYRNNIKKKLQGRQADHEVKLRNQFQVRRALDEVIRSSSAGDIISVLKLVEKWDAVLFRSYIQKLAAFSNKSVRQFAVEKLNDASDQALSWDWKNKAPVIAGSNDTRSGEWIDVLRSGDREDRKRLAGWLARNFHEENSAILLELLNDYDPRVRNAAIEAAARIRRKETYPSLIHLLASPKFADKACTAFVSIGEEAFPYLENAFYKSGQDVKVMLRILQAYGRVGGEKAVELLWDKIDYPDKKIDAQVLLSLGECGFCANALQSQRIKFSIESDIANVAWNLKALEALRSDESAALVRQALEYDTLATVKHVFMLLSMIFERHSIQLVQENLFGKRGEGLTYAIELLDVFLSDDLKEKIIFLLDDTLESRELNKLAAYYPQAGSDFAGTIKMIINRDNNLISRWTKSCAIHHVGERKLNGFEIDLTANLFNPDALIREMSAWALMRINPAAYVFHSGRLDPSVRKDIESMFNGNRRQPVKKIARFEKVLGLAKIDLFSSMPGQILSGLSELAAEKYLTEGASFQIKEERDDFLYIAYEGKVEVISENGGRSVITGPCMVGGIETSGYAELHALTDSMILTIDKDKFYDYLSGDVEWMLLMLYNVSSITANREGAMV